MKKVFLSITFETHGELAAIKHIAHFACLQFIPFVASGTVAQIGSLEVRETIVQCRETFDSNKGRFLQSEEK